MTDELSQTCWECRRDPCKCEQAAKPSDQQGASLEGEAVVWVQLEDGKPVALSFTRNEAAGCTTPFTASKASPDDQRQEGWRESRRVVVEWLELSDDG